MLVCVNKWWYSCLLDRSLRSDERSRRLLPAGSLARRSGTLHSGTNTGPWEAKPSESICAGGNAHARQQCCELTAGTESRMDAALPTRRDQMCMLIKSSISESHPAPWTATYTSHVYVCYLRPYHFLVYFFNNNYEGMIKVTYFVSVHNTFEGTTFIRYLLK